MDGDFLQSFTRMVAESARQRLDSWGAAELAGSISLERPAASDHGDLSLNLAMAAAAKAHRPPRELAVELLSDLQDDPDEYRNLWDDPACQELKARLILKLLHAEMGKEPLWMPRVAGA